MQQAPILTDPRFDPPPEEHDEYEDPPRPRSLAATCLMGCAIMLAIAAVIAVIGGFWVARNWRDWLSTSAATIIKQGIDDSQLPPAEKEEIKLQVDRVTDAFRDGQLSNQQVGMIFEKLAASPLMTSLIATAADRQYFEQSGLSEEEKVEGRRNLRRLTRGVIDGKINEQSLDAVLVFVADRQPNGKWRLREQVSDENLRKFLESAKTEADRADIAEEPPEIDPSDEVKRIIDEVMFGPEPMVENAQPPDGARNAMPIDDREADDDRPPSMEPVTTPEQEISTEETVPLEASPDGPVPPGD